MNTVEVTGEQFAVFNELPKTTKRRIKIRYYFEKNKLIKKIDYDFGFKYGSNIVKTTRE